jgi:hypothetical protein
LVNCSVHLLDWACLSLPGHWYPLHWCTILRCCRMGSLCICLQFISTVPCDQRPSQNLTSRFQALSGFHQYESESRMCQTGPTLKAHWTFMLSTGFRCIFPFIPDLLLHYSNFPAFLNKAALMAY